MKCGAHATGSNAISLAEELLPSPPPDLQLISTLVFIVRVPYEALQLRYGETKTITET